MLIFLAYPPHLPTLKGREMALPQFAKLISLEVVSILMLAILMLVYLCIYHLRIMIFFIGPSSMDAFSIQALIIYCFASKLYLLFLSSRNPDPLLSILMTSVSTLLIRAQPDQPATQAR